MASIIRARVAAAAGAVCVVTLIGGCAAQGGSADAHVAPPPAAPTPVLSSVSQRALPLTSYQLTETQAADVEYLTLRARQACMKEYGFTFLPDLSASMVGTLAGAERADDTRLYGVSDPAAVQRYGYHVPPAPGSQQLELASKLPAAERAVLDGTVASYGGRNVPAGGCLAQSTREIGAEGLGDATAEPGSGAPAALVSNIGLDSFNKAQADPRVLAVFARWSACMSAHGDHYSSPFKAAADPRWASTTPSAVEIATAKYDVACKVQVNLIGVEYAVVSDYQNAGIALNASAMESIKSAVSKEANVADQLMNKET
jgi:hypothetical protein